METVSDFILGGSEITADGACRHEIKRCLLLGRKVMTDLDSIFKSRDITLPTKGHLVKAMVFPVIFPYYFWNSTFKWVYLSFSPLPLTSLLVTAISSPPQTTILPFCISFSWECFWSLPPVKCQEPLSIDFQALCVSDQSTESICHFHCLIIRGLI